MKRFRGLPIIATGDHYKDFKIIKALQEELAEYANTLVEEANRHRDTKAEVARLLRDGLGLSLHREELERELALEKELTDLHASGATCAEAEVERLRAALEGMVVKLGEGLRCGIGPSTGEPLNQRERDIIKGILKLALAALAPEVK